MNIYKNNLHKLLYIIVIGFGIGYLPFSGTIATIISSIVWYCIASVNNFNVLKFIVITILSTLLCHIINNHSNIKDHYSIVLDEFIGTGIIILLLPDNSFIEILFSIFLFRVLDIIKPWPISYLNNINNGFGIMADDILAALITIGIILLLKNFI
ncbi:MAG: phosphatidylglycerophosphatase A [Candidatus Lightella neohaematopini]|nr:phosphatidylglycerophosphatase A [Candidatus Lightella neohaematopini]